MKVYVTRYCLTEGIIEADLEDNGTYFWGKLEDGCHTGAYKKTEAFVSLADAKGHAEELRRKKIRSLELKIDKLEATRF